MFKISQTAEDFCQAITRLDTNHAKALANLVMALASHKTDKVVSLSESPFYHYQYSSICDAINALCHHESDYERVCRLIRQLCLSHHQKPRDGLYRINSDATTLLKPHSSTLLERSKVHVPNNVVTGNKPLGIGYRASTITLSEYDEWQLTVSMRRIEVTQSATDMLLSQLESIFSDTKLPFARADLVINRLDRAYANAKYLSPAHAHQNLVSIVRFRQGQKVWLAQKEAHTGGRNRIYSPQPHYLHQSSLTKAYKYKNEIREVFQASIFDVKPTEQHQVCSITGKNRKLVHYLYAWNEILLRSKAGHKMNDKPVNLVAIITKDAKTAQQIFQSPMFLVVSGSDKAKITPQMAFDEYMRRYAIEPFFRFNKQELLLDSFQTPDRQHLDNWLLVVQMAVWLLFLTANQAQHTCHKWQKYLEKEKITANVLNRQLRLSIAQAKKAANSLFITFSKICFLPKKSQKGKPRQKGQTQTQRTRHEIYQKKKKTPA